MLSPPVKPMLATSVDRLPGEGACRGGCRYEPKWDGWRALLFRSADGVYLQSRTGKALGRYFPDVVALARATLPPGAVLDGELIIWDTERGRTSFSALQERLTSAGSPSGTGHAEAHFVAFDLLQAPRGTELLGLPLSERRRQLTRLLAGAPAPLSLCPQTDSLEQATEWLTSWPAAGVEGLMVKGATTAYRPGERGWSKLRHRSTTEAVVGGVTGPVDAPETLLLGRFDGAGRLRFVGRTVAVKPALRAAVGAALHPASDRPAPHRAARDRPATDPASSDPGSSDPGSSDPTATSPVAHDQEHPWPQPMPVGWLFGGATAVPYVPVRPQLVVEIEVDATYEHGRWRHPPRLLRPRPDLTVADVTTFDGMP